MAYGSTQAKRKGIARQSSIISGLSSSFFRHGYPNRVITSAVNEDRNHHIDATYFFDGPGFMGHQELPVDVKSTPSLTIFNSIKRDTLKNSKAIYFVFEYSEDSQEYLFIKRTKLIEVMNLYHPKILTGYDGISRYFWMNTYLNSHSDKFNSEELFTIKK